MVFRMSSLFNERKAAEVAAYFLLRARKTGASMTLLKLMKLMYLSERSSYERFGFPIIGDRLVSMPNGPVLSLTLNIINSREPNEGGAWYELIAQKNGRDMTLNGH